MPISIPTSDEIVTRFETRIRAECASGDVEEKKYLKLQRSNVYPAWISPSPGLQTLQIRDGLLLFRIETQFNIDNHRDGQLQSVVEELQRISGALRDAIPPNSRATVMFDSPDATSIPAGTMVTYRAKGTIRIESTTH